MTIIGKPVDRPLLGLIGFGAFGRLLAQHLAPYFKLCVHDPLFAAGHRDESRDVEVTSLAKAAGCSVVVLATPVHSLADVISAVGPHLRRGALVLDVGSVKTLPVDLMRAGLPAHVGIVATHPLFGPQSAHAGIRGLKIAVCPVRGGQGYRVAAFLRRALGLRVILTTPDAHDRDAAIVQGLTHVIARLLVEMEPLPSRMTTRSFDLIMQAVTMVRHDAPDVFDAIERLNPHSVEVRQRFLALASELDASLAERRHSGGKFEPACKGT